MAKIAEVPVDEEGVFAHPLIAREGDMLVIRVEITAIADNTYLDVAGFQTGDPSVLHKIAREAER